MRTLISLLPLIGLSACIWVSDAEYDDQFGSLTDADGDGYQDEAYGGDDCDDSDADVHPGAEEVCNDIDDDCSGSADDELVAAWYPDDDGDEWGDDGGVLNTCDPESGWVEQGGDCDDGDSDVNPGADELCNGVDDDCDDETDEGDATDATIWYLDSDGDGFGDMSESTSACIAPSDHVDNGDDCDDTEEDINPDASEYCNGIDDDCDEETDEADALDATTWYADEDEDGYGDPDNTTRACSQPTGYLEDSTDCDDGDDGIHPGGIETLGDSSDGDCDGDDDSFSFTLHDTRSAQDVEGPRLAQGSGEVYLAWAAEEIDDGGTLYDAVGVSVFDGEDPSAGELNFWSGGEGSDLGQLNRFDFVANDDLWVTGTSWLDITDRYIRLDGVDSSTLASGTLANYGSWAVAFDQLQLGLSSLDNVTAIGCGMDGAGIQAVQAYAPYIAAGTGFAVAEGEALAGTDDHDVCEYDHVLYAFYTGNSTLRRMDTYVLDSSGVYNYSTSSYQWQMTDAEISTANNYVSWVYGDTLSSNGVYMDVESLAGGSNPYVWDYPSYSPVEIDASPSPTGAVYTCMVDSSGGASLLWSELLGGGSATVNTVDLVADDLGTIEDCAVVVGADSLAWLALRSGDDIALATVEVP